MLLEVENLVIDIATPRGLERIIRGVSFSLDDGGKFSASSGSRAPARR